MTAQPSPADARRWLEAAARWRAASLLFRPPSAAVATELGALAGELAGGAATALTPFLDLPLDDWERAYHAVLGPSGVAACESSYDDAAFASRGPVIADVAGFYRAFGFVADPGLGEVPDHLSVELSFLAYLAVKAAYARHHGLDEAVTVTEDAYGKFLDDHLLFWEARFRGRLAAAGSDLYDAAARWLAACAGRG